MSGCLRRGPGGGGKITKFKTLLVNDSCSEENAYGKNR